MYNNFKNMSIVLGNLGVADLPKSLEFGGNKFVVKPEFHITLLNFERIAKLIDSANVEKLKPDILSEFYEFVNKQPLTQYTLSKELRLVRAGENKTIVVLAKLKGIDKLFDTLSKKYGVALPVQPTHITLYTLPTDTFGIPINSYEELKKISKLVDLPELQTLLAQ